MQFFRVSATPVIIITVTAAASMVLMVCLQSYVTFKLWKLSMFDTLIVDVKENPK